MKKNKLKRILRKIIKMLIVLYVVLGAVIYFTQEKMMFIPDKLDKDHEYRFETSFEEVFLEGEKEGIINALHFKVPNSKGVILYFHGNAGSLDQWGLVAEQFAARNYDVFIMDYRSYGKSTGLMNQTILYNDAQLCYDYLLKEYNAKDITVYGRSLGTTFASYIAGNNEVKQLLLEAPFKSFEDIANRRFPIYPTSYLLKYKMPSDKYILGVTCPVTVFHGTKDYVVAYESGKALFDLIPHENKTMVTIPDAGHHRLYEHETCQHYFDQLL